MYKGCPHVGKHSRAYPAPVDISFSHPTHPISPQRRDRGNCPAFPPTTPEMAQLKLPAGTLALLAVVALLLPFNGHCDGSTTKPIENGSPLYSEDNKVVQGATWTRLPHAEGVNVKEAELIRVRKDGLEPKFYQVLGDTKQSMHVVVGGASLRLHPTEAKRSKAAESTDREGSLHNQDTDEVEPDATWTRLPHAEGADVKQGEHVTVQKGTSPSKSYRVLRDPATHSLYVVVAGVKLRLDGAPTHSEGKLGKAKISEDEVKPGAEGNAKHEEIGPIPKVYKVHKDAEHSLHVVVGGERLRLFRTDERPDATLGNAKGNQGDGQNPLYTKEGKVTPGTTWTRLPHAEGVNVKEGESVRVHRKPKVGNTEEIHRTLLAVTKRSSTPTKTRKVIEGVSRKALSKANEYELKCSTVTKRAPYRENRANKWIQCCDKTDHRYAVPFILLAYNNPSCSAHDEK